jgi:hypothetical protein
MLRGVIWFLIGILVLVIVLWGFHEVIPFLGLPVEIAHVATVILGVIALLCLVLLAVRIFSGGGPPGPGGPGPWSL